MEQKGSLNADTVRGNATDGECLIDIALPHADDHALENLYTFAVPFHNPDVNLHRVTRCKFRGFFLKIFHRSDKINCVCHFIVTLPNGLMRLFHVRLAQWLRSQRTIIAP